MGTRGVPPRYGGFETFAAELGTRLVARGDEVWVYCREPGPAEWNGLHRLVLPSLGHKYFETVSHTFLSALRPRVAHAGSIAFHVSTLADMVCIDFGESIG